MSPQPATHYADGGWLVRLAHGVYAFPNDEFGVYGALKFLLFAMKGGTAINLFVGDMPRLSVDIDVVYLPWQTPRDEALQAVNQELAAIATRIAPLGVQTRLVRAKDLGDTKLIVENDAAQVKIEVNVVFRGSVLPVERRPLSAKTGDLFGVEFELPVLAPDELYASKLVAALDRQHPRDLFDVWQLFWSGDISDGMVECFVIYLAGDNPKFLSHPDSIGIRGGSNSGGGWIFVLVTMICLTMYCTRARQRAVLAN